MNTETLNEEAVAFRSKTVHIRNTSGSQLDVSTVGVVLEKDAITSDSYRLERLEDSGEIKKYLNLGFIQLLDDDAVAKLKASQQQVVKAAAALTLKDSDDILSNESEQLEAATKKLQEAMDILKAVVSGAKVPKTTKTAAPAIPTIETEAGQGKHITASTEGKDENSSAQGADDDEFFPEKPPTGMTPRNDVTKRFLGSAPYNVPMMDTLKKVTLENCLDIGTLREIILFEKPGEIRELAKAQLKKAKRMAQV